MIKKIINFFSLEKKEVEQKKIVLVKYPPKCLVCESDMETLKMNHPFCDECLVVLKKIINKKKKKNND